eukprot:1504544-Pyramimonas_sp.AAC.1
MHQSTKTHTHTHTRAGAARRAPALPAPCCRWRGDCPDRRPSQPESSEGPLTGARGLASPAAARSASSGRCVWALTLRRGSLLA